MTLPEPSPAQLARFDQEWADINFVLDSLIDAYMTLLASFSGREVCIHTLCMALRHTINPDNHPDLLACAIHRLSGADLV